MIEKSRLLSLFEKLISIDSPSFGEREMGDFVTKKLRSLGLSGLLGSTFGGSDNNYLAQRGIQGLVVATAMNNCHSVSEYTTEAELMREAVLLFNERTKLTAEKTIEYFI